jgi:hypothetical protein
MAATLAEVLKNPNYVNANAATKAAIFDKFSAKDPNYTNANDATKAAIRNKFGVEAPAEAPLMAPPVEVRPDAIPERDMVQKYVFPALEVALPVAGALIGGTGATVFGPAGTVAGGTAGAGLGYGAAKELERLYEEKTGKREPQSLAQSAGEAAQNVLTGATFEAGGRVILPPVAKAAGWLWDRATGKLVQIKAGKIVQELAGDQLEALKAASKAAPEGLTGAQSVAGVEAAPIQTLGQRVAERAPYTYRPIDKAQREEAKNILASIAKGGTATESKIAQEEARNALNRELIPTLTTELEAANIAGRALPRLEGQAQRFGEAAASKVQDVRRMTAAGERAAERAANTIPVAGQPRVPGRYTYAGQLEKQAENVAAKAAEGSLAFGEASRFAQAGADSLAAYGLKPLKSDAIISNLKRKAANPEFAGNDLVEGALKNVADDIARWTKSGGVIDAWALDSIRKNSVNAAVQKLRPGMDQNQQKNLAAGVLNDIKPVIIDSIENAGGTGYGQYLADYAVGRQAIAQTKLGARAMELFNNSPDKFIALVEGNSPKEIEKVFGAGSYNIAKEMSAQAFDALRGVAAGVSRTKSMAEQAKAGATMYENVLRKNISGPRLPNILSAKVAVTNETLDILENKVNKKVMDALTEGMRSGKTLNNLLTTLPADQRLTVLRTLAKDPRTQSVFSANVNALIQEENRNALAQ